MSPNRPRVIAQERFEQHQHHLDSLSLRQRFEYIYHHDLWGSEECRSGLGSILLETAVLRRRIVDLLAQLEAQSLLDVPCGDFHWLSQVDLGVTYIGPISSTPSSSPTSSARLAHPLVSPLRSYTNQPARPSPPSRCRPLP